MHCSVLNTPILDNKPLGGMIGQRYNLAMYLSYESDLMYR